MKKPCAQWQHIDWLLLQWHMATWPTSLHQDVRGDMCGFQAWSVNCPSRDIHQHSISLFVSWNGGENHQRILEAHFWRWQRGSWPGSLKSCVEQALYSFPALNSWFRLPQEKEHLLCSRHCILGLFVLQVTLKTMATIHSFFFFPWHIFSECQNIMRSTGTMVTDTCSCHHDFCILVTAPICYPVYITFVSIWILILNLIWQNIKCKASTFFNRMQKEMSPRGVYKHGKIRNLNEYSFFLNERWAVVRT